jgi:hypothetical protein
MMSEAEYQLLTRALCCLAATEPDRFQACDALHSKLIFNKAQLLEAAIPKVTPVATTRPLR